VTSATSWAAIHAGRKSLRRRPIFEGIGPQCWTTRWPKPNAKIREEAEAEERRRRAQVKAMPKYATINVTRSTVFAQAQARYRDTRKGAYAVGNIRAADSRPPASYLTCCRPRTRVAGRARLRRSLDIGRGACRGRLPAVSWPTARRPTDVDINRMFFGGDGLRCPSRPPHRAYSLRLATTAASAWVACVRSKGHPTGRLRTGTASEIELK